MIRFAQISLILLGLCLYACEGDNVNGNNPPTLVYEGLEKSEMRQSPRADSVVILLQFEDVDGDIGGVNQANITVTDNRNGSQYISLSFPDLPNVGNTQQGSLRIFLPNTCCIYPPSAMTPDCERNPRFPDNKFTVDISIQDLNGNRSNTITTDTLTLNCI